MASSEVVPEAHPAGTGEVGVLRRDIDWKGAFWVAIGVPALVLFSMGGISATVGAPAWLVWTISVTFGFIQAFTYAEIAGLFPNKSGGASVYGATAWVRYSKYLAPVSLWCNWLAWTPVLAIGCGLAAGYLLSIFFAPDAAVNTWQLTLVSLDFLKTDLAIRVNATFFIGAGLLLAVFAMQHHGILRTARIQTVLALGALMPLLVVSVVPLLTGDVALANFSPFTPLALDDAGNVVAGAWDIPGWTLFLGGLFIAAWSAYAFETAICYTSEFKNPGRDTPRAIIYSGLLCIAVYILVPVAFQGVLGTQGMLEPGIAEGSGVGAALAGMLGAGSFVTNIFVVLLVFTLLLAVMTSMAGSSRTLYQGGVDGWLPGYLSKVNQHGAPTRAMWTDLTFNLGLLLMSDYLFVLAVSNVNYLIFNFLNLNAGWIHRKDNAHVPRPWRAPTVLLGAGIFLSFVNAFLLGAGANVWGQGTLFAGFLSAALVLPFFVYRHFVRDKGVFPQHMWYDLLPEGQTELGPRRAGVLPYVTLAAGLATVLVAYVIFWT
jgi:amino acid transporter